MYEIYGTVLILLFTTGSLIRPKIVRSVHYCPATKKSLERRYTDMTSLEATPSSGAYPTKDEDGNLLETEFGLSVYKDHQTFSIQVQFLAMLQLVYFLNIHILISTLVILVRLF